MAGISGDPGTTSQQGVAGATDTVGIPEPVRHNPAESVRDGKKQITVRAIRVKDLAGVGSRNVHVDAEGDLITGAAGGGSLPFEFDQVAVTNVADGTAGAGEVAERGYLLSSITQGTKVYVYNAYNNISREELVISATTTSIWTYTYDSDNQTLTGIAES